MDFYLKCTVHRTRKIKQEGSQGKSQNPAQGSKWVGSSRAGAQQRSGEHSRSEGAEWGKATAGVH